ncbi:helix-turn-helix transcriptional regulator [Brevundimonas sp. SL161]|uniref:helix-turn-helix transcriptional regulator n=1 Tax=Brevundimonas sp. SL161 TaxID=2804613 RepID=UPI003CF16486
MTAAKLISVDEVAEVSGISKSHLIRLRNYQPDRSPPFLRLGRRCLYPVAALDAWIAERVAATRGAL